MSSFGQVPLKEIWAMLEKCAPGHTPPHETDHFYRIRFNGLTYASFPKKKLVDVGHVRKMARHLQILDCAKQFLDL
jgi:hypothetical protein